MENLGYRLAAISIDLSNSVPSAVIDFKTAEDAVNVIKKTRGQLSTPEGLLLKLALYHRSRGDNSKEDTETSVFLNNVSLKASEQNVKNLFESVGEVKAVSLVTHREILLILAK